MLILLWAIVATLGFIALFFGWTGSKEDEMFSVILIGSTLFMLYTAYTYPETRTFSAPKTEKACTCKK